MTSADFEAVRAAHFAHIAMLERSDVDKHRSEAKIIAFAALKKKRAAAARHLRSTEPSKSRQAALVAAYDRLIDEVSAT